jgi:hypothetical protein
MRYPAGPLVFDLFAIVTVQRGISGRLVKLLVLCGLPLNPDHTSMLLAADPAEAVTGHSLRHPLLVSTLAARHQPFNQLKSY